MSNKSHSESSEPMSHEQHRFKSPFAGEVCEDFFLALQRSFGNWRLQISWLVHDHVIGDVVSLTFEWDMYVPLRMTYAPWQWPLSVFLYLKYTLYACRASWHNGCSLFSYLWKVLAETLDQEVPVQVFTAVVWHCVTGQGTSPVCALCPPRSEWVLGWTVTACVFEYIVSNAVMVAGLYAPQGVELVLQSTGPTTSLREKAVLLNGLPDMWCYKSYLVLLCDLDSAAYHL